MKLGFTGSRMGMTAAQAATFKRLISEENVTLFVHGDCVGADAEAHDMIEAIKPEVNIVVAPSLNATLRAWRKPRTGVLCEARASVDRNRAIAVMCEMLVATPRQRVVSTSGFILPSGTEQTINFALDYGRPVRVIKEDGTIETVTAGEANVT